MIRLGGCLCICCVIAPSTASATPSQAEKNPPNPQTDPESSPPPASVPVPPELPASPPEVPPLGTVAATGPLGQQTGNCELFGEVSDATTLNPLAGVVVELSGLGRSTETDSQGKFRFSGLPVGEVTIDVSQLGYQGETRTLHTLEGQPAEARFGLRA